VCGEDGPEGVVVDDVRRQLQQFALDRREEGALLAIASKNTERDVWDTFAAQPTMPLRPEHFVAWRINWDPKPRHLVEIAEELSLSLDSFILVDDNPRECAEVADTLPPVLALTLPADAASIPHFLQHVWAFDRPVVTEEDRRRNAYYSRAQEFGRELKKAESFEQFLASLHLRVDFFEPASKDLARVAQLTQRTNQFNFTTRRRTESEMQALALQWGFPHSGARCLAARVKDRFGDYGVVGVVITVDTGEVTEMDTFLLSCRVLGRGVEHQILAEVANLSQERGLAKIRLRWSPTAKNLPARQFLESVLHRDIDPDREFVVEVPCETLTGLKYVPPAASEAPKSKVASPAKPTERLFMDFARIANDLSTPEKILATIRRQRSIPAGPSSVAAGLSETEARLAAIWRDLLETGSVSPSDNFFDIGGHSLLAVMLILRVKETFGVELPVEDVYSPSMSLEELALKIESYQLSGVKPDQYADLLAQIEQLSDEEVHRLLEEEGKGV
jgi:FkbH-like protein